MWKALCDELPYWNRSQLSSSREDDDVELEDDDADVDPDADVDAVADAPAARARTVSNDPAWASSVCLELSRDSSRCAIELSSLTDGYASVVAERDALADDSPEADADAACVGWGAWRYGCSAASGTMTSRVASALMSVR